MATGVTTTIGRVPIPFAGLGSFGSRDRVSPARRRQAFSGSSELVAIANEALGRYRNAVDTAQEACYSQSGLFQSAFNWATGNTSTESICRAAAQMELNYGEYRSRVNDPATSDDAIAEIIGFVNKEIGIQDLVDLARSTNAVTVTGKALLAAPGTAVGLAASGAESIVGGILGNIPWWAWAAGAAFVAVQLGWKPLRR